MNDAQFNILGRVLGAGIVLLCVASVVCFLIAIVTLSPAFASFSFSGMIGAAFLFGIAGAIHAAR